MYQIIVHPGYKKDHILMKTLVRSLTLAFGGRALWWLPIVTQPGSLDAIFSLTPRPWIGIFFPLHPFAPSRFKIIVLS
jgi:hypothetical protein